MRVLRPHQLVIWPRPLVVACMEGIIIVPNCVTRIEVGEELSSIDSEFGDVERWFQSV